MTAWTIVVSIMTFLGTISSLRMQHDGSCASRWLPRYSTHRYITIMVPFYLLPPKLILRELLEPHLMTDTLNVVPILTNFTTTLRAALVAHAKDPHVAGFKSIVCYRTGLD